MSLILIDCLQSYSDVNAQNNENHKIVSYTKRHHTLKINWNQLKSY